MLDLARPPSPKTGMMKIEGQIHSSAHQVSFNGRPEPLRGFASDAIHSRGSDTVRIERNRRAASPVFVAGRQNSTGLFKVKECDKGALALALAVALRNVSSCPPLASA